MTITINAQKRRFILELLIFYSLIIILTLLINSWHLAGLEHRKQQEDMRKALDQFSRLILQKRVPIAPLNQNFITYIIDNKHGRLILARGKINYPHQQKDLWEYYKTKLIYQMQKEKEGLIQYPKSKALLDSLNGRNIIIFHYLEEFDWIIAAEAHMPHPIKTLKSRLNQKFVLYTIAILAGLALVVIWIVHRNLSVIQRLILDNMDNNFIPVQPKQEWGEPIINDSMENQNEEEAVNVTGKENVLSVEFAQQPVADSDMDEYVFDPSSDSPIKMTPEDEQDVSERNLYTKLTHQDEFKPHKAPNSSDNSIDPNDQMRETELARNDHGGNKPLEESQDLTLNLHDIKSAVLKKMIKKMRKKD